MSRLEEHRKRQYRNKVFLFIAVIAVLLFVMFQFGIKTLISATLFINNFGGGQKDTNTTNSQDDFFGTFELYEPPVATNSSQIEVSGTVSSYDALEFYINDEKVLDKRLTSESFVETIGDLKDGDNKIYVKALAKKEKKEQKSTVYTVKYKKDKPKLDVSEPQNNTKTDKVDIIIAGTTDIDVTIRINESPVVVDAQGNFRTSVRLKEGDNKVTITALDEAGNTEMKEINVKYEKD